MDDCLEEMIRDFGEKQFVRVFVYDSFKFDFEQPLYP